MNDAGLLVVDNVSRTYPDGRVTALVNVNLRIERGEYVAIMGPSGSGKSTLLNVLGALDRPDSGQVLYRGKPLGTGISLDQYHAMEIGFIFQSFYLLPTLTALENVQVPMFEGPLAATSRVKKARELLDIVGMSHRLDHHPSRLSVGERQRVAIARALANDPQLLLADEPTGNLDSRTAEAVLELFGRLRSERGLTLIVVTHSEEVAQRANRIVRIRDGQIIEDRLVR